MGIDINGSMMVGCPAENLVYDDKDGEYELYDYIEDTGLDTLSPWYDASTDECFCGFEIPDVDIEDIDEWVKEVKKKAKEFKELTGCESTLVGMQDVW